MKKILTIIMLFSILTLLLGCEKGIYGNTTLTVTTATTTTTKILGNQEYYDLLISEIDEIHYGNSSNRLLKIAEYLNYLPDSFSDVALLRQQYNEVNDAFSNRVVLSIDTSFEDLFAFYSAVKNVDDKYVKWNFDDMYPQIFEVMFFGEWISDNYSVGRQRVYSNYANTETSDWFSNNLPNSKIYGTAYYYYNNYDNHKMIVGYQDRVTNEKTDNYEITFFANSILVYSLIESKTYTLSRNLTYPRVVRDSAKMAYEYIARIVQNFKDPQTLVIRQCHVYSDEGYVVFESSAANSVGGIVIKTYKVTKVGNYYSATEISSNTNSNIDVDELNEKIQAYIDSIYP